MKLFNIFLFTSVFAILIAIWSLFFVDTLMLNYIFAFLGLFAGIAVFIITIRKKLRKSYGIVLILSSIIALYLIYAVDMALNDDYPYDFDPDSEYYQPPATIDSNGQFIDAPFDSLLIDPDAIQDLPFNSTDTANILPPAPM